jgi:DNA-binding NarL/FixJ family response regulator
MRFLLVEENKDFREYLKELISNHGDECIDLKEGISLNKDYRDYLPDLVVIDLEMKNISGFKAAKELLSEFPDARIAFLTNFEDELLHKAAESIGVKTVIPKESLYEFYDIIKSEMNNLPAEP